jgi:hypothetical protein
MSWRPRLRASAALLAAATITTGGCAAIKDPYAAGARATTAAATSTPAPDAGDPSPERGGTIPAPANGGQNRLAAGAAQPTPQAALARYAQVYATWTAADVVARQRELASISLGQARAQALQAAASAQRDPLLARSRVANTGQVVAIGAGESPAAGEWVIVTREQTTGRGDYAGLPPTLHVTYAHVTHTRGGWVVSRWSPQT